jgi:ankyrin repeat protein
VSDPKALDSEALRETARNGHTDIVMLLIPVSGTKTEGNSALHWAAENGHLDIALIL